MSRQACKACTPVQRACRLCTPSRQACRLCTPVWQGCTPYARLLKACEWRAASARLKKRRAAAAHLFSKACKGRGLDSLRTGGPAHTPLHAFFVGRARGARLLFRGCTPCTPAWLGYARLEKACILPTGVHASLEGRAQLARPSKGACTLCTPLQRVVHQRRTPLCRCAARRR